MPSSILNSDDGVISGTAGLKNSGGDDGVLLIQNNGTDAITVADDGEVTLAAGLTVASPIIAAAGTALLPSITTTGDVNTGIFFSAANTVDIATDGVAKAQINSAGDFAINAGFGSVGKAYLCRAWVNFKGTGTVAIRASGNVSSIADIGTGNYRVNLAAGMPDTNYAPIASGHDDGLNPSVTKTTEPVTASQALLVCSNSSNSSVDVGVITFCIFR